MRPSRHHGRFPVQAIAVSVGRISFPPQWLIEPGHQPLRRGMTAGLAAPVSMAIVFGWDRPGREPKAASAPRTSPSALDPRRRAQAPTRHAVRRRQYECREEIAVWPPAPPRIEASPPSRRDRHPRRRRWRVSFSANRLQEWPKAHHSPEATQGPTTGSRSWPMWVLPYLQEDGLREGGLSHGRAAKLRHQLAMLQPWPREIFFSAAHQVILRGRHWATDVEEIFSPSKGWGWRRHQKALPPRGATRHRSGRHEG
ncbi:hypothetical protein DesfrDRAFT_0656 [Solidesulfovibrio fructosivorans JJ]]|uniref:Uncharacterized protein n=1 Tax=Solidesulfovibrio fructosivorans JJ] TaxID=596151 RepID=E1JSR7_SOLFR|nr:hypothetical protein DesfrDRAFT_0656 [Solidesulfovibrio fructosivorans JJ]]